MTKALAIAFLSMAAACATAQDELPSNSAGAGGGLSVDISSGSGDGAEACAQPGQSRACWTGAESLRNVGDCHDGTQQCVETTNGEFATSTWGPCTGEELDCGGGESSGGGDEQSPPGCEGICTAGQWGDSPPAITEQRHESNSVITTAGGGSVHLEVVGDHNLITTDGGGSCVFDVYGSHNTITFAGGGSNVVNIMDGTDNTVDFSPGGGCNSVYFEQGSLTSIIPSCGWAGDNVNGQPAEDVVYTLP